MLKFCRNMKNIISIIFTFLICNSCATRLECCKTNDEVKELLTGYWKEEGLIIKSLDSYSFDEKTGYYAEIDFQIEYFTLNRIYI